MNISAIVAMAQNRVIGRQNSIPWSIPEDLRWFKKITLHHCVIMGRKTFESIGKPLPDRKNLVISRKKLVCLGVQVFHSLSQALQFCEDGREKEVFIIGGAQIYELALPYITRIYLTLIHQSISGDCFFPDFSFFKTIYSETHRNTQFEYSFMILERSLL